MLVEPYCQSITEPCPVHGIGGVVDGRITSGIGIGIGIIGGCGIPIHSQGLCLSDWTLRDSGSDVTRFVNKHIGQIGVASKIQKMAPQKIQSTLYYLRWDWVFDCNRQICAGRVSANRDRLELVPIGRETCPVRQLEWFAIDILIGIHPARKPNRIALHIPRKPGGVVAKSGMVESRLRIKLLSWEAETLCCERTGERGPAERLVNGAPDDCLITLCQLLWSAKAVRMRVIKCPARRVSSRSAKA